MSEAKNPELSPKEQRAQDQQSVQSQLIATDVNRQVQNVMDSFGSGRPGSSGRTSFEGHELNAMIDLIENSNPEHLENAGAALLKARTAIKDAAKELGDFIKAVDWEGESGTAFRDWGNGLVAHATKLGDFAEAAGTQITVAGTGLASVRNSLPPRDSRLVRKSVDDIETPKRIGGNPEYVAAVKVEKDRQEAINQANRLASYYAVSEETLAAQEPPRFDKQLGIAMPRPHSLRVGDKPGDSSVGSETLNNGMTQGSSDGAAATGAGTPGTRGVGGRAAIEALGTAPVPDKTISTEIDSVTAPRAPATVHDTSPVPSTTGPTGPGAGPTPPVAHDFVKPVADSWRRSTTSTGLPRAIGQPGKNGPMNSGPVANGRAGAPVGRPPVLGGGPSQGTSGRPGGGGNQSPVVGRPGVTGGRPVQGGQAGTPRPPGPPAGRANGIVGGTPQRAVPGTGTSVGARGVPRGGVIGAGGTSSGPRAGGRGTPGSNGVVGTPRRGGAGSGSTRGFTAGGAGLARGPAGRRGSDDEEQNDGMPRPDYLREDRETWEAGRRGAVPPVID
ncbi:WXG100 family type VII secretion target [Streptomyces sp. NBC_01435]|uniref:WXG100 family type VII secretion target n=1 Tax=Streptomyces sp. NBC_01435 TaxID=2903865 RepID=UPI002E3146CA|nr:WXG100 family type VII secretion target [Streptomyces sp. NBC_01435]